MGIGADLWKQFANDEQDPTVVADVHKRVSEILTTGEEIQYIAVQKKPLLNLHPDCLVLTNRRFILYKPSFLGNVTFEDYIWRDLYDAKLRESLLGAAITMMTVHQRLIGIGYLPKVQARRLYAIAQGMEERSREERRLRSLEEKRAAAGGIVMHGTPMASAPATASSDPVEKLQKLKAMFDAGLITQAEFDSKKAEILSTL